MKSKIVMMGCVVTLFLTTTNCTTNDPLGVNDNCATTWTENVSAELTAYTNSITAYSENPTAENCSDVKSDAKNYLDALSEALKCVPTASRAQINEAINEAKADVDNEDCG